MTYPHGLVVGKFCPPHAGHHHLIERATEQAERVTVLVVDTPGVIDVPAMTRANWLREMHPNATVHVIPDIGKDDDSVAWGAHTVEFLGRAPDAVFSSESYGVPYAAAMGCVHVAVDPPRERFPVSGTAVRRDPVANWRFLSPPVRAHYAFRVVAVGAESTGTTTLSRALAAHYRTVWVPEYGRLYSQGKYADDARVWRTDEFVHIANAQSAMEDVLARSANEVLICDTDAYATSLWHERYMGTRSTEVERIAAERVPDLYLLTGDEIPFEQDGLRDMEEGRHTMHARFEETLPRRGVPWVLLRGNEKDRLREAIYAIDSRHHSVASGGASGSGNSVPRNERICDNEASWANMPSFHE